MLTNSIKHSLFLWELEEHWFVYFQLIMKIFTETDTDVSAAQANATGSWENSSERTQFLIKFGSAQAKLQRIFSLFCWDCAALGGQNIGREISKFEKRREKRNVDKDAQRALPYRLVSSFRVISLHILKRPQKFETISHLIWHLLSKRQIMWEIISNFVAFLEKQNFTKNSWGSPGNYIHKDGIGKPNCAAPGCNSNLQNV